MNNSGAANANFNSKWDWNPNHSVDSNMSAWQPPAQTSYSFFNNHSFSQRIPTNNFQPVFMSDD